MTLRTFALPMTLALLLIGPAASGQEGGLTAEEIDEGWIMLFDGESTFGWTVEAEEPSEAVSVADGKLMITGPATVKTTTEFGAVSVRVVADADGQSDLRLLRPSGIGPGVVLSGDDDRITLELAPEAAEARHAVALVVPEGASLAVREVVLKPLGLTPIFNGEDLSGWNVLEGGESVYSVTDEGYLNVKDGRGDIQTEGQYDDFIFQLDVFVNGKNLNSGIFFRAIPGQFWSGYESQIRNEYEGDDRTKPVDYGTGAIYRRQAARKIVADDFEWFTKTIVAHDNHFAVWVDGYQVTDWTDEREPADNGRNGYKAAPGVISIQGHDPTTDLSFRDLRISQLPGD